jgi:hypothetical protein
MITFHATPGLPESCTGQWLLPPVGWLALLSLLLAACSTPLSVSPGTSETQVSAHFGRPDAEYRLTDGEGSRFEYDRGPIGRVTYMVDFGPDGRAVKAWQALTAEHFARIRIGVDTADSIRREFGRPDRIVPSQHGPDYARWDYPFFEDGVWNSIMSITFDGRGIARYVEDGPDPRYLGGR